MKKELMKGIAFTSYATSFTFEKMPIFTSFQRTALSLAIWEITEKSESLKKYLSLQMEIDAHTNQDRNAQWMACRMALQTILPEEGVQLYKDEFGKPHVAGDLHISLSHTGKFAAAVISQNEIGVDIEEITPRIKRIAKRFLHPQEMDFVKSLDNLQMLYLIWCAKEAMFKLYGKKSIDFAEHIRVMPFDLAEEGEFEVKFTKNQPLTYRAEYRIFDNHAVVWVM